MKSSRSYCNLGALAEQTGWKKRELIGKLEAKRKVRSAKFHELKVRRQNARTKALGDKTVADFNKQLAVFGY